MTDSVRVLHVDDDREFAALTSDFLEREGNQFEVTTEVRATDALDRLDQEADKVDCVVSDYNIPGMDGVEFLGAVRAEYPELPFILFTGKGSEEVASEAISAGVTDYLRKGGGADRYAILANRIENAVKQRRAEAKLRRRERRFQALLKHSSDRLIVLDEDWRYKFATPAVERLMGCAPDELIGKSVDDYIHPEDRERVRETTKQLLDNPDEVISQEYRIRHHDGSWRWVESLETNRLDDPAIEGIVINSRDITERKCRERQLERERDRYRTLFETCPVPTVRVSASMDGIDPVIQSVNPAFTEVFGYEESEAVGEALNDLIVPEDRHEEADRIDQLVVDGQLPPEEVRRQTADGELRDFIFVGAAAEPDDGRVEGFGIYTDVTERRESERALERERDRLDTFAGIVSHDLRTPLTTALGRIELAEDDCESPHLDHAASALDRMETIIGDTLAYARRGELANDPEPIALGEAVAGCWSRLSVSDATLRTDTLPTVLADPDGLDRLLENLFRNAVKHGSTGSRAGGSDGANGDGITVTVGRLDDGFYVADDGGGIPEAVRDTLFEPGETTAADGTGFGLSIVEAIAEAHGWEVRAVDDPDGARFEVTGIDVEVTA